MREFLFVLLVLAVTFSVLALATAHIWMVPREHLPKRRGAPGKRRKSEDKPEQSGPEE